MDYKNGKIYTIRSPHTEKYYIGATTQSLAKRFSLHKKKTNGCSSKDIINLGDAYIELLEEFPCDNKEQLNAREGQLQREHKEHLINIRIETRTRVEWKQNDRELNREKYNQTQLAYMTKNKDKINAQRRERRKLAKIDLA